MELDEQQQPRYPIRTVATLTGVNPITLRAWERRYGLVKPTRTDKGHRLYSQQDIDTIYQINTLLDKGLAISQVKQVLIDKSQQAQSISVTDVWVHYRQQMLLAVSRFDDKALEIVYHNALSTYPSDMVLRLLVIPLLQTLGKRWETREGTVAEEHFFSVFVRNKIGARFHHSAATEQGQRLVLGCLPNELHEIGLLLFGLAAQAHGYRLVILGSNLVLADLPMVVKRSKSQAIVLSGTINPSPKILREELPELVAKANLPIFIGGRVSTHARDEIIRAGAIPLGEDLHQSLKIVDSHLFNPEDSITATEEEDDDDDDESDLNTLFPN